MKKVFGLSFIALTVILSTLEVGITSCTKTHDTLTVIHNDTTYVIAKDTIPVVNAGSDTTIQLHLSTDSIRLNGSATDQNDKIVSYLWSQVSGPNSSTIANPGSAATFVYNLVAGKYIFQLMSIDADGETGVKSVAITILAPTTRNVQLQGTGSTDLHLAYLTGTGDISDPNTIEFSATAWTNGNLAFTRGLFKFDLSSIPANAKIISAKLSLYSDPTPINGDLVHANSGTNNSMLLQRVTGNWDASTKWQTQPGTDASTQIIIPHTNQPFLDLLDIDVTSMVQTMVQTGNNYGWMIKLQNEVAYNSRIFVSNKNSDASRKPKLVLQYTY